MCAARVTVLLALGALAVAGCGAGSSGSLTARVSTQSTRGSASSAPGARPAAGAGVLPPAASASAQLFVRAGERLRPGTVVRPANLGVGVFADARHGFALASIGYETYPAATIDGGRTWRIDGPVLPIPAAGGPAAGGPAAGGLTGGPAAGAPAAGGPTASGQPGVAGPETYFASEGLAGTTVVDVTTDAGKHWWQAFLPGGVVFVGAFDGELTAIIAVPVGNPQSAGVEFWAYHSKSGKRWDYDATLNPVS
jgi:hypothetical protein